MRALCSLLSAALALAACDAPPHAPAATAEAELVTSLAQMEGRWAIARFRDFEPSWRTHIGWRAAYVHVTDGRLAYSIGCNHSGNRASIDAAGVLHDEDKGGRTSTLMGCSASAPVKDRDFYAFFGTTPVVTRLGEDRIRMASGAAELILERPDLRRRATLPGPAEIQGRWVPQFLDIFSGQGMSGFSMEEPRGVVTLSTAAMGWSGCREAAVAVAYSPDLRLVRRSGPRGDCKLGEGPGRDGATRLMRIMRSNPLADRTGLNTIVLYTDDEAVHLEREGTTLSPPALPPAPASADGAGAAPPPAPQVQR